MTDSPVIFQSRAGGREVAMLGIIEVGEINPYSAPGRGENCYWRLFLPFASPWARAASYESARGRLTVKIEQWLEAAGLVPLVKPDIRAFRPDDWGKIKQAVRT